MDEATMRAEIERLAPFHHDVALPHGLSTNPNPTIPRDEARVQALASHSFPAIEDALGGFDGRRVLDAACNAGGFSVEAARRGARVVGFDIVERYLEQARFINEALGLSIEFRKLGIYDVSPESVGTFDVVLCFGLLYHLENPVGAMRALASVTDQVLAVDTALYPGKDPEEPLWRMNVVPPAKGPKGASTNLWRDRSYCQMEPNGRAVRRLLRALGFSRVERLAPEVRAFPETYRDGRRSTFVATR
jgi:tRNA (mo5U34)-methyltransferase